MRAARPFAVFCSDFYTLECTLCDYALCYSAFASFQSLSCCCCFSDSSSAFCRACACALSSFAEHRSLQTTLVKRPSAGFSSLVDSSRFSLLLPRTLGGALWSPRVFEGCFRSCLASLVFRRAVNLLLQALLKAQMHLVSKVSVLLHRLTMAAMPVPAWLPVALTAHAP